MEQENNKMAAIGAQGAIEIELSTRPALRLWQGREKTEKRHGIIGLPGFSKIMKGIESSVRNDDPYADYHYHRIEEGIQNLTEQLNQEYDDIQSFLELNVPSAMRLPDVISEKPTVVPVRFASKLGFQLVYQILKVDQIVLKVLVANHIGLLSNSIKFETIARVEKRVRSVMHLVFGYHNTGVTRDDMASNNKKALFAIEKMGELEKGYLDATLRSESAPPLPMKRLRTLGNQFKPKGNNNDKESISIESQLDSILDELPETA